MHVLTPKSTARNGRCQQMSTDRELKCVKEARAVQKSYAISLSIPDRE